MLCRVRIWALAKQVVTDDDFADDMTFGIQTRTMQLLALQQPMARDLRFVGASMRIVVDLERIGDHACDIAKITRRLAGQSFFKPLVDIPRLGELARKMVGDSLQAFINHDTNLALQVAADDDAVDDLCARLEAELMDKMRVDSSLVEQATQLLLVARMLERVADHATNIVENIYYLETGEMRPLAREAHNEHSAALANIAKTDALREALQTGGPDHHHRETVARLTQVQDGELPASLNAKLVDSADELSDETSQNGHGSQNGHH